MASVNKVILVGNLGRDPEMRSFPNGDQVANVTLATTDKWKLGHIFGVVAYALDCLGQKQQIQTGRDGARVFHHVGDELAYKAIEFRID